MANVIVPNNPYVATTNSFEAIWRLTRAMKKAGWNVLATSTGAAKLAPANNATDQWGNNADPLLDVYPTAFSSALPWIVLQGPSTVKIPISAPPTGNPLRGEKITQGSAEGELLGFTYDPGTASGWMVVAPRVGTFSIPAVITCSISGATFIPTGVIVVFSREVMISKSNGGDSSSGNIFYICADISAESAQLYSTLATSAGCTPGIAPGCGGTGNAFPALGIAVRGTGGSVVSNQYLMGQQAAGWIGNYHVGCANAIGSAGTSPDGSFYVAGSNSSSGVTLGGFIYTKVDDSDPGDCDPYIFMHNSQVNASAWSRTTSTGSGSSAFPFSYLAILGTLYIMSVGYQARGCPVSARDVAVPYYGAVYSATGSNQTITFNYPASLRTLNHPSSNPPLTREGLIIWCPGTTSGTIKHYKGRARWIGMYSQGSMLDTFDNKKFMCVNTYNTSGPAISIGPWDGITTPIA